MTPRTQYVDNDGYSIAYQVTGDGPTDVLLVQGLISHLDLQWCDPVFSQFLHALAARYRLILMDQRGVGLSDGPGFIASVDQRATDIAAVLAAAQSSRAFVIGHCHGGPPAVVHAATNPEQVAGLVLMSTFATGIADPNNPAVIPEAEYARWRGIVENWGEGRSLRYFNPSRDEGSLYRHMYAAFERAALPRGMARRAVASTREIDISPVLPAVAVPTLVLHSENDFMPVAAGEHLAASIPGARFVALPGSDHAPFAGVGSPRVIEEILGFVGNVPRGDVTPRQRFGAIVMTDIVRSTESAVRLGDTAWAEAIVSHDARVRDEIDQHRGECLKFTGDGHLAVFTSCEDALRCADAIRSTSTALGFDLRCGVHAGGYEPVGNDAIGLSVITAARLMAAAGTGQILASEVVIRAVTGSAFTFAPPRPFTLKGIAGDVTAAEIIDTPAASAHLRREERSADPAPRHDRWIMLGAKRFPELARPVSKTWWRRFSRTPHGDAAPRRPAPQIPQPR